MNKSFRSRMYFKRGAVYVNFSGNRMCRFLSVKGETVLVANMMAPGGTEELDRTYFEKEFTEKTDVPKPVALQEQRANAVPEYIKKQAWNPYAR